MLIFVFFIVSLITFPFQFKNQRQNIPAPEVFFEAGSKIDLNILNSDQVKSLKTFSGIEKEFNYTAQDEKGRQIIGKVLAVSKDEAEKVLEGMGLQVSELEEASIGRSEPFIPY